ncbi:MAG: AtpZ/AtpI family protein [Bacteroidia bacterium]
MRYVSFGFELIASILVPILLGRWIDTHWELDFPTGTLVGAFLGCVMAIYLMIRTYKQQSRDRNES